MRRQQQPRGLGTFVRAAFGFISSGWGSGYDSTNPRTDSTKRWKPALGSGNQVLGPTLTRLVAQTRDLTRNSGIARGMQEGLKAGVIGTGIDVEPDTGDDAQDELIKDEFSKWAESCGVNGESLWELQSHACGELADSGAPLWQFVILPERIEQGLLPLAILVLDVEWFSATPCEPVAAGNVFVQGVELDSYARPVAYHLVNPECLSKPGRRLMACTTDPIWGPQPQIIHCFEKRRAQQAHGEPILAPSITTIRQAHRLVQSELNASVNSSAYAVAITGENHPDDLDEDGGYTEEIASGSQVRLFPGESAHMLQMTRPSQLIGPFFGLLRGLIASASRVSQFFLDRDPSRASYSSGRLDQQMDLRLHKPLQLILGRHCATAPYKAVFPWICMRLAIPAPRNAIARARLMQHELLPDGQPYVDPQKDVAAAAGAVTAGFSNWTDEIGKRGGSIRRIWRQLAKDMRLAKSLGLVLDLSGTNAPAADSTVKPDPEPAATPVPAPEPA